MDTIRKMYFPHDQLASELTGITISEINHAINISLISPFELRRCEFYALICITEGEVNHYVGDREIVIKANQCFLATKGEMHALCRSSNYHGYIIAFTDLFIHEYLSNNAIVLLENCCSNLYMLNNLFHTPNLKLIIKSLLSEIDSDSKLKLHHIGSLISIYLLKIMELEVFSSVSKDIERNHFLKFEKLVREHFSRTRNIQEYAQMIPISGTYLNVICKKFSGVTAKKFIANIIVDKAKTKLSSSSLQYKDIAERLGFNDTSNFYNYFKKHTLQNPSDYRRDNRPKYEFSAQRRFQDKRFCNS